jgi:hypothetical protein
MRFDMHFDMDNAAFEDAPHMEIKTIFDGIVELVRMNVEEGTIFDSNGNKVGEWGVSE